MYRLIYISSFLLFAFLHFNGLHGQERYNIDQIVHINDDPEVTFRPDVKEGANGFIWLATNSGLCRFDGQRFKYYRHDADDPSSIFSNEVFCLLPVGEEVWVGTLQGISVLNINTHQFRNYQLDENGKIDSLFRGERKDVISILEDRQGVIWIGTKFLGLWKYEPEEDNFTRVSIEHYADFTPSFNSSKVINVLEQSCQNDSIIWAGTATGIMEVNKYTEEICFYAFPNEDNSYRSGLNLIRDIYHHSNGLVYVGTWDNGLYEFDPVLKTLQQVQPLNDPHQLLSKRPVGWIIPKSDTELWVTSNAGLFLYSTVDNRLVDWFSNDPKREKYYGIHLVDRNNRAWQANFQGLFLYDPFIQQFYHYNFDSLIDVSQVGIVFLQQYDHEKDRLLVCPRASDGIYIFDKKQNKWTVSRFKNKRQFSGKEPFMVIYGFNQLGPDEFILSGYSGLFRYRLSTALLEPIILDPSFAGISWTETLLDGEGKFWVGTMDKGLFRIDLQTGEYTVFSQEFMLNNHLPTRIGTMFEDSRGNIYIKRIDGFSVYLRREDQFHHFLYTENPDNSFPVVNDWAEDKYGRVWTCSEEGRMGYLEVEHPEKGLIEKTSIHDDGLQGQIKGLTSDAEGNIWGITIKDIYRIDREGKVPAHFSLKYSSAPLDFFGMDMLPDGQMVITGRKGITLTYPQALKRNDEKPVPFITQVTVRQKPVEDSYPLFGNQALDLRHNENFFSFAYAAQAFTFGKDVRFRYRLDNLEGWVDAKDQLVANYTNVPPGEYTFQLMAANNEGGWNDRMLEIPVTIRQAWFKSWWFLSILGLFIALMVFSVFQYRIQQIRKEEKIKTAYERKLASVEMSALVSQMNPHFLFNSLNSIDSYIIRNQPFKASDYLNKFAHLIRLILQNSQSTYISLENEVNGLELYLQMESMRSTGTFIYDMHISPDVDLHQIEIPPMLIQPYVENSIWHGLRHLNGEREGRVDLSIAMVEKKLQITILDNGIGRVQSAELQKRKSGSHKRSMGMQITQNRIEMINKLYKADASVVITDLYDDKGVAEGTKVTLTIAI